MQDVIDSDDNQFFISTHSPYVANCLMEGIHDDLAIWFVNMNDGVTTVRRASDDELKEIIRYGVDIWTGTVIKLPVY